MQLCELFKGLEYDTKLKDNLNFTAVVADSRHIKDGCLYVCIKGLNFDGHTAAGTALRDGAAAVVTEYDLEIPNQIIVKDTQYAYAILVANLLDNPAKKMKFVGITGTNGKTTCTYLMKQILEYAGEKVGLIGTIHNEIGSLVLPSKHTTPDALTFHTMLARMVDAGCTYVVMEVSSHGLVQQRVAGIQFAAGVFTNLTQDHLDYHGTMEEYYLAKKKLFDYCDVKVVNYDNSYGKRLAEELGEGAITFSTQSDSATYTAKEIKLGSGGSTFMLLGNSTLERAKINQPGQFSVENAMAAASAAMGLGIPSRTVVDALAQSSGVTGRFEVITEQDNYVIIRDYAHAPDGIEKILTAVRTLTVGRIVTLFGCAGNRDRTKRPKMGEIAASLSDFVILTSDNPRSEDPEQIIEDTLPGIIKTGTPYMAISDRYDAIEWAINNLKDGDVLMLLGKGHEDYQVLKNGTIYFDEKIVVEEILKGQSKSQNKGY